MKSELEQTESILGKMHSRVRVQCTQEELAPVRTIKEELDVIDRTGEACDDNGVSCDPQMRRKQLINKMYLCTGEAKLRAVVQYVQDVLQAHGKVVIFGHHQCMLDGLEA